MLKKLVPALALTGLAFGSGLCFNPYNHDYGTIFKGLGYGLGNKTIILHNGKMQLDKYTRIKLIKYTVNDNKALILIRGAGAYFVVYTECINGKPVTKDIESIGSSSSASMRTVNLPNYPIKLGFYKDGYWVKSLTVGFQDGWYHHPGGYYCYYTTQYFPYKLIKEHKGGDGPMKTHNFPAGVCRVLGHEVGI
jgi:hypothetical protein